MQTNIISKHTIFVNNFFNCLFNFLISIFCISAAPGGAVVGNVYPDAGGLEEIYQVRTKRQKDTERVCGNLPGASSLPPL